MNRYRVSRVTGKGLVEITHVAADEFVKRNGEMGTIFYNVNKPFWGRETMEIVAWFPYIENVFVEKVIDLFDGGLDQ